MPFFYFRN